LDLKTWLDAQYYHYLKNNFKSKLQTKILVVTQMHFYKNVLNFLIKNFKHIHLIFIPNSNLITANRYMNAL